MSELPPLPEPEREWDEEARMYGPGLRPTFAQLRAYAEAYAAAKVAEERERCAATWEKIIADAYEGQRYDDMLRAYNEKIRAG